MIVGQLIQRHEIDDLRWNQFVNRSPQHSIYAQTWYLDALYDHWSAIIVSQHNQWLGIMPLNIKSKFSISYAIQPVFAQYLGIIYSPFSGLSNKELNLKKKIINLALSLLPKNLKVISFHFHPSFKFFLPFYWQGYKTSPRFTYQLPLNQGVKSIYSNYSSRITRHINKAQKHGLTCYQDSSIKNLISLCKKNKIITGQECEKFEELWKVVIHLNHGFCLYVKDKAGNIHSGGAFIKDQEKLIFMMLSSCKEFKKYGSTAFLIHESIKNACLNPNYQYFDFEGSMIESVEYYFRGFNPDPVIYFQIEKNKLGPLFKFYQTIKKRFSHLRLS